MTPFVKAAAAILAMALAAAGTAQEPASKPARTSKPGPLNAQILAMGDNTWLKLNPPREPAARAYSGACMGDGLVWYFGGGHAGYKYNDVELYSLSANRWDKATEPEDWTLIPEAKGMGGGWGVHALSSKNRPLGEHTMQQVCWVPERKKFFAVLTPGTWEFDPEKKEWECLAGVHAAKLAKKQPSSPFSPKLCVGSMFVTYDPVIQKPLCFAMWPDLEVWAFDFGRMEWEKLVTGLSDVKSQIIWYSTYLNDFGCHLICHLKTYGESEGQWWRFYADKRKYEPVTLPNLPMGCLTYDSANKVVVGIGWIYNPAANTLTKLDSPGVRPAVEAYGKYGRLWYDPRHNACIYVHDASYTNYEGGRCETWAYRYKKGRAR